MADQDQDQGITAYHGSPYEFDRFDVSKIGTGEGAQSYGHGLYFAEHEPVAVGYRDSLVDPQQTALQFEGKPLDTPWNDEIRERWPHHFEGKSEEHQDAMEALLGNLSQVREMDQIKHVLASLGPKERNLFQRVVSKGITKPDLGKGHMYEVSINAHPDHFLDWDKPLSEQSEHVKNALTTGRNAFTPESLQEIQEMYGKKNGGFGGAFHEFLQSEYKSIKDQKAASNWLLNRGIKGIKYLDAGSRGQGDGTRNYVVFDDKLVNVKRRYAQGGKVEDRPHFGFGGEGEGPEAGSTGSASGNSYGGDSGSSSGGIGSDYGADNSGADYGGGGYGYGQSGYGGNGGGDSGWASDRGSSGNAGRDYLSNMMGQSDRFGGSEIMSPFAGTRMGVPAASQQQMLDVLGIDGKPENTGMPTNLRPGGNIAADFLKGTMGGAGLATTANPIDDRTPQQIESTQRAINWGEKIGSGINALRDALSAQPEGISDPSIVARSSMPSEQPSNMFGQPQFGTTQFGQSPMSSGFPSASIQDPSIVSRQADMKSRDLADVMGTKPQGEYLLSGMDVSQRAVPNTYSVDPSSVISQVRKEWPTMTGAMNDQDIQNAILGGLPQGISYKNGILTGDINDPALQATLQKGGVSMQTFKPVTETAATTQWGQPQAGASRSVSMDGVAPQTFGGMYPVSLTMTPVETAAEAARPPIGFPNMANQPLQAPSPAVQQTVRENFNSAFADARSRGEATFTWTNPATGKTSLYTTQLARKQGGRVPSMSEPDEWLAEKNESKKPERGAVAKRSGVLSSRKS